MDIVEFRDYCMSLEQVTEETPFGPETLVFKVAGKIFALCGIDNFVSINLKCDPEKAVQLREEYDQVKPAWHMNKKHWNTVLLEGFSVPMLQELILHSYSLVVKSLPKKVQAEF
ncbi:MAG: MmcQ/YjbR family DNA-binding protein [Bacteroidia bacterium]|nr:MmcQ/YjbR family DNA-binding protein [Bacteroidia bacterium]